MAQEKCNYLVQWEDSRLTKLRVLGPNCYYIDMMLFEKSTMKSGLCAYILEKEWNTWDILFSRLIWIMILIVNFTHYIELTTKISKITLKLLK